MIGGAIFDVDGTLIDSMPMWATFGSSIVKKFGKVPESDLDIKIRYFSLRETAEYLSKVYEIGSADEVEELCMSSTRDFYLNKVMPKSGVKNFLSRLKDAGVKMYIATATYRPLIEGALKRLGMMDYFEGMLTCAEVGAGKDKPDIFERALSALGCDRKDTWVFEDAMHAMLTASGLGFQVCGVYDDTEADHVDDIKSICRIYVKSFSELSIEQF